MDFTNENIKFKSVIKIDRIVEKCTNIANLTNINDFLMNVLFEQIKIDTNKRKFEASNPSTQIYSFCSNLITNYSEEFVKTEQFNKHLYHNAMRLLNSEIEAQKRLANLKNVEVTRGSLITALIQDNIHSHIVFVKIEHDEYIDDILYEYRGGMPTKNKKYKSCIFSFKGKELSNIMLFDPNNTEYWYRDFLELNKVGDDSKFTTKAIRVIKDSINCFNDDHPQDCVNLLQLTNTYFSTNSIFILSEIIEKIENYTCFDENFKTKEVINKIYEYKEKKRNYFENTFEIDRNKIKKQLTQRYKVNKKVEIELIPDNNSNDTLVKMNNNNIKNFIVSCKEDDKAFLKLYTDDKSILRKFNYEKEDFDNIISMEEFDFAEVATAKE